MKYFTLDLWISNQSLDEDHNVVPVAEEYARHLDAIRGRLPPELVRMLETLTLHDSRLRELSVNLGQRHVAITFNAADNTGEKAVDVRLHYGGVDQVTSTADPLRGLAGPHGYGDLGYDELDVADNKLEHRLLFSTGIELTIRFEEFRFELL